MQASTTRTACCVPMTLWPSSQLGAEGSQSEAIAAELSLGADSFVFADDNPAERAIVAAQVPGVAVPALDGAENYIKTLDHGGYFEVTALSKEDLKKPSFTTRMPSGPKHRRPLPITANIWTVWR